MQLAINVRSLYNLRPGFSNFYETWSSTEYMTYRDIATCFLKLWFRVDRFKVFATYIYVRSFIKVVYIVTLVKRNVLLSVCQFRITSNVIPNTRQDVR
jgi:hypothetical protein